MILELKKIKSATVSLESETWNAPGQNTGVGNLSLLQGIFPTQGSKPGLPHCRRILYQLSHKGLVNRWGKVWVLLLTAAAGKGTFNHPHVLTA